MAETSSFVASVFCYDQAIKHDIRKLILLVGTDQYSYYDREYEEEYYYDEDVDDYVGGGYCSPDEQLYISGHGAKRIAAHLKVSSAISELLLQ